METVEESHRKVRVVDCKNRIMRRDLTKDSMREMEDGSDIVAENENGNENEGEGGLDSSDDVEGVVQDCQCGRIWGR